MNFEFTDSQKLLIDQIIRFGRSELNENFPQRESAGKFYRKLWNRCAEYGIISLSFPEEFGGAAGDFLTQLLVVEALGYSCADTGLVKSLITQICISLQILKFGSDEQKKRLLPELLRGKLIGAQAITESDAGSDISATKTKAIRQNDGFVLNGTKMYITNGPISDIVSVMAKTDNSDATFSNFSWFLIESDFKGFIKGQKLDKMGLRTLQNCELIFEDCQIPRKNLLGKEGQGIFIFNEIMEYERLLMSACHLGNLQRILELTMEYANSRIQFGKSIGKFQAVSHKIAEMKTNLEVGRNMLYKAGWMKNVNKRASLETAIAKKFISEKLKAAAVDALQIHGAFGYMKESEIERYLRDSLASTIISGTSEILENLIAKLSGVKI